MGREEADAGKPSSTPVCRNSYSRVGHQETEEKKYGFNPVQTNAK